MADIMAALKRTPIPMWIVLIVSIATLATVTYQMYVTKASSGCYRKPSGQCIIWWIQGGHKFEQEVVPPNPCPC